MAGSQPPSDALGVVGTIAQYAVGTTLGSSSFACNARIASTSGQASCESCRFTNSPICQGFGMRYSFND